MKRSSDHRASALLVRSWPLRLRAEHQASTSAKQLRSKTVVFTTKSSRRATSKSPSTARPQVRTISARRSGSSTCVWTGRRPRRTYSYRVTATQQIRVERASRKATEYKWDVKLPPRTVAPVAITAASR